MDIAALIIAPLLLALVYSWRGMGKLPGIVRVGLPVGLMAVLFMAFMGYGPAVQEAIITKTPLIRAFDLRNFALHLDGLSLLFGLLFTGIGAVIALYAGSVFKEGDVYRRFARGLMALVGAMLGLVLLDHALSFSGFWIMMIIFAFVSVRQRDNKWAWMAFAMASLGGIALLVGFLVLSEAGAQARMLEQPLYDISQISASNLSRHEAYNICFIAILIAALSAGLQIFFSKGDSWAASTHISLWSGIYLLARLYPALHDNPLWWSVVTGVGLLVMLIGAVWALRQKDLKAILVYRTMSAFGACVALLGLPEFLGAKVALIGVIVHALLGAALFLSLDISRKRSRLIIVGLAMLLMAIFHVQMIGAFYQVTLAWAGVALAAVMVSTALWGVSSIKVMRDSVVASDDTRANLEERPAELPLQPYRPIAERVAGLLLVGALAGVVLFDAIFALLLNPLMIPQRLAGDMVTPLILGIIAIVGGGVLYATREVWGISLNLTLDPSP